MIAVTINRLKTRMSIPQGAMRDKTRIARIVGMTFDDMLETAVERSLISSHGLLCIRELHAAVRLRLRELDSTLAAKLAQAIAGAIAGALNGESRSSVYYGSRVHALIDLMLSAIHADFGRAWAWIQLGMWHDDARRSASATTEQVMRAIASESQHAVAALTYLASDRLACGALLEWATPAAWVLVTRGAIREAGSTADLIDPVKTELTNSIAEHVAARIVRQSIIAGAVSVRTMRGLPRITIRALAALAILEVDPAVLRVSTASARALITATEQLLQIANADQSTPPPQQTTKSAGDDRFSDLKARHRSEPRGEPVDERPLPDIRSRATTKAGGLLYLINLAARIELPERILGDHRFTERGLRWVLHQISMSLLELAPSDPAALAFAGLLPNATPLSKEQTPPDDAELVAIAECRAAIVDGLHDALGDRIEPSQKLDGALLDFVCRRSAEIVADPGWIEIHFSLDQVSTEIRSAGLDVDPGWVRWLGVTVRFVYA
jgi:hypothetical protein